MSLPALGTASLGRPKPKQVSIDALLAETGSCVGQFVTSTVRYHYKTGLPEVVLVIVACRFQGVSYRFLFGLDGSHAPSYPV